MTPTGPNGHKTPCLKPLGMMRLPSIWSSTQKFLFAFSDAAKLDAVLEPLEIMRLQLPYRAAFLAGKAFLKYRRQGGDRSSPLPDFYIGAHAVSEKMKLITRDTKRFRSYFPGINFVTP